MSKLLTPKIHTSSSSTKILRIAYILLNQNTHTTPTQATLHTPLSPVPTPHPLKTTKSIYSLFLNQNTHANYIDDNRFRTTKKNNYVFLNTTEFILAKSSRFGPPPAISSCVGTPGVGGYTLSGSDGYHNECGYPTAEHSERHTS